MEKVLYKAINCGFVCNLDVVIKKHAQAVGNLSKSRNNVCRDLEVVEQSLKIDL